MFHLSWLNYAPGVRSARNQEITDIVTLKYTGIQIRNEQCLLNRDVCSSMVSVMKAVATLFVRSIDRSMLRIKLPSPFTAAPLLDDD